MNDPRVSDAPGTSGVVAPDQNGSAAIDQANRSTGGSARLRRWSLKYGLLGAWAIEILVFTLLDPHTFFTADDAKSLLSSQGALLVLAFSVVPTLSVGEIDLSIASVMTLSATLVGQLNGMDHWSLGVSLVIAIAAAPLVGLINGIVTVYMGVQGIIVTLGMGTFLLGLSEGISHSLTVGGVSVHLENAMNNDLLGISLSFWYALGIMVILWYLFRHTPLGRRLLFVGFNREVARLSGVPVPRLRILGFVSGALLAGLAGIITVGVAGGLQPSSLQSLLLPAFAAAFVGSTIFVPGRVNTLGSFVAVLFLQTGITGLELRGLTDWVEDVFYGAALVIAVVGSRFFYLRARRAGES